MSYNCRSLLYIQYHILKLTTREIAEFHNLKAHTTILRKLKKFKISLRKRNEINSGKFKNGHKPWHDGRNGYIEKVPTWKDWNDLQISSRHFRIYKLKEKPNKCEICDKKKKLHLSNKDHKYSENIIDWQWICQSCHHKWDVKYNDKTYRRRSICLITDGAR